MTEAVLLVGGRGTRLRPLTIEVPKPLLPVAGVPFLRHLLVRAREAGLEHVVLATSYRPEVFAAAVGDGTALGLRVDYANEAVPRGTGGAIRNAARMLDSGPDEPVVVLNSDVLADHDIAAQVRAHLAAGADVTLALTEVGDPRAFGAVPTDGSGRVTAFLEKAAEPVTNRVNAGCYVFARRVIDQIPPDRAVSVERETFPGLLARGAVVRGQLEGGYWLDVGTPAALVRASCDLVLGRLGSAALPGPVGEALVLDDAWVAPDAVLCGGTTVGARATVAPGARVEGSLLLDGVTVGDGALVRDTVVGRSAVIGAGCVLDGVVVGHRAEVGAGNELLAGARVWSDATIPAGALRFSTDELPG